MSCRHHIRRTSERDEGLRPWTGVGWHFELGDHSGRLEDCFAVPVGVFDKWPDHLITFARTRPGAGRGGEAMKIARVETYLVGASWKNWLFVRVVTDEGLWVIGEATLNDFGRTCEAAVHELGDLHARLAPSEAVVFIALCTDLDVFWGEEPTTREREEPTSAVAANTAGRVATGENFHTVGQFLTLLKAGKVSILQPEPMSLGGLLPSLAVSAMAAADGAWVAPHQSGGPVATAVCLQLAACVPNFLVQEYFDLFNEPWTTDLVTWAPQIDHATGELSLPDGSGLGVDLNLDVALAHPYDPNAFLDVTSEGWEHRLGSHEARTPSGP